MWDLIDQQQCNDKDSMDAYLISHLRRERSGTRSEIALPVRSAAHLKVHQSRPQHLRDSCGCARTTRSMSRELHHEMQ